MSDRKIVAPDPRVSPQDPNRPKLIAPLYKAQQAPSLGVHSPPTMKKESSPSDSLTPQRKHRKLLKDGSGTEVWPEAIEKTFVQGMSFSMSLFFSTLPHSFVRSQGILAVALCHLFSFTRAQSMA